MTGIRTIQSHQYRELLRHLWRALPVMLAAVLISTLMTCSPPQDLLSRVIASGTLRVATINSPTTYYQTASDASGFDYELAQYFAESLGVELELLVVDSHAAALQAVADRRAHIAAAGITVTDNERKRFNFGPTLQTVRAELVYRMGTPRPRSIDDLDGTLMVPRGTVHAEQLTELSEAHPNLVWGEADEQEAEALLYAVEQGDLRYTVAHSTLVAVHQRYYPRLRVAFPLTGDQPLAWAFRRSPDRSLVDAADAFFEEFPGTVMAELLARHFGSGGPLDFVSTITLAEHIKTRLPAFRAYFEAEAKAQGLDWRLLAAVGYQESHWNPHAVSPTGVRGLMMLTRDTAAFLDVADREDPAQSIAGGARYLRRFLDHFDEVPEPDRTWLALAAYNLGLGHALDLRTLTEMRGGDRNRWTDLRKNLPLLTQRQWHTKTRYGYARGFEALHYVKSVRTYYDMLVWKTDTAFARESADEDTDDNDLPGGDEAELLPTAPPNGRSPLQLQPPLL
jgi:membrane-bound lytic murein transglycosylase F